MTQSIDNNNHSNNRKYREHNNKDDKITTGANLTAVSPGSGELVVAQNGTFELRDMTVTECGNCFQYTVSATMKFTRTIIRYLGCREMEEMAVTAEEREAMGGRREEGEALFTTIPLQGL